MFDEEGLLPSTIRISGVPSAKLEKDREIDLLLEGLFAIKLEYEE